MRTPIFTGCGVALITPMHNGMVDFEALGTLIEAQIEGGVAALIACGTTGEPSTMSEQEQDDVISYTVSRTAGRVPVIAGTGGNCTAHVIARAKRAQMLGANAQLCVTPYYNKTTQRGLIAHYTAIAQGSDLPILLYNVPSRTALNLEPDTLDEIIRLDNVVGLKEANADRQHIRRVMDVCRDRVAVYSGNDELTAEMMSQGASGVISVLANLLPRDAAHLTSLRGTEAERAQARLNPLISALFLETSPIPCKAAMHMLSLCDDEVRLPLIPMSESGRQTLRAALRALGLTTE